MSSWWAGGTNGAMSSIYNSYDREKWEVSVFFLSRTGKRTVPYQPLLLDNHPFLSAYYCNRKEFVGTERLLYYVAKAVKKITRAIGINLEPFLFRRAAKKIEKTREFDTVVAYIEGNVTRFGTYFSTPNKVAWIHCDYNNYLPAGKTEEEYYEQYKTVVTVSKYTSRVFADRYPSLKNRVKTIYNLFDDERIKHLSLEPVDDTRFLTDSFTIISVGRVHPVKRFSAIPQIASLLKERGHAIRWYIIGPDFDEGERKAIEQNISKYRVADCVSWLGGKANPYPFFKAADLYVCTSYSEACPMVFNEARSVGIPVISADFPSAYEFITDGKDGLIASLDKLNEQIERLIIDKKLYMLLKESSMKYHYDNESLLRQMDIIF
mgnify:CR=1 FL=1